MTCLGCDTDIGMWRRLTAKWYCSEQCFLEHRHTKTAANPMACLQCRNQLGLMRRLKALHYCSEPCYLAARPLRGGEELRKGPPRKAEYLFHLFLDAKNCDAVVGDLEERYPRICREFGHRKANFWYWTQALTSVGPIAWAAAKRFVLKPGAAIIGSAVAHKLLSESSWLAVLAEAWQKVRG